MHRFYLPPEECHGGRLSLSGREAHHALRVLRLRVGDTVTVLDGAGRQWECDIAEITRNSVGLEARSNKFAPRPPFQITLIQAIPKGKIIESIIQKSVELGAYRIVPLLSERVVTRLDRRAAEERREQWDQIAIEALKQSGSPWRPAIETPLTPAEFLKRSEKFELPLIASLHGETRTVRERFNDFSRQHQRLPASVCVWVGPEGDFTPEEVRAARASGALPITLGPLILRAETAATYCLAVLNHELQTP